VRRKCKFLGKKILFVTAHPDDESYLCSGTMIRNFKARGKNILFCATAGEAGKAHLGTSATKAELKKIRKQELERVSRFLKVEKLFCPGLPDGDLESCKKKFFQKIASVAKSHKPELIIGFGPDGITGHHDHVAAWKVGSLAAKKFNLPYVSFTLPPHAVKREKGWLENRRHADHYHNDLDHAHPNLRVEIDPGVKLEALSYHKSQLDAGSAFKGYPKVTVKQMLAADYFWCD